MTSENMMSNVQEQLAHTLLGLSAVEKSPHLEHACLQWADRWIHSGQGAA